MPKLQQVRRANGSYIHTVNLPIDDIIESGWKKGDELIIEGSLTDSGFKFIIFKA